MSKQSDLVGFTQGSVKLTVDANSTEEDVVLIQDSNDVDVASLRINNGAFIVKGKNASQPVQLQTHDGNEDIEVDPDGFIKMETAGSERLRIDASGNLLVGVTSSADIAGTTNTGFMFKNDQLQVTGPNTVAYVTTAASGTQNYFSFYSQTTATGSITTNGTTTAYNTSSDYRLKENVVSLTGAADRLMQIPVCRFNFIVDPDRTVDGFLAHEVQAFVPECVTGEKDQVETVDVTDEDGNVIGTEERPVYQGIDQSKLVPLLTAALQEALQKIDALETRISALETN